MDHSRGSNPRPVKKVGESATRLVFVELFLFTLPVRFQRKILLVGSAPSPISFEELRSLFLLLTLAINVIIGPFLKLLSVTAVFPATS